MQKKGEEMEERDLELIYAIINEVIEDEVLNILIRRGIHSDIADRYTYSELDDSLRNIKREIENILRELDRSQRDVLIPILPELRILKNYEKED